MTDLDQNYLATIEPWQAQWLLEREKDGTVAASRSGQPYVTQKGWKIILQMGTYEFPEGSDPLTVEFVQAAHNMGDIAILVDAIEYVAALVLLKELSEAEPV